MKLTASRSDLLTALDRVSRIAKSGTRPFMETLLLRATDSGEIHLGATDFEVEAEVVCSGSVTAPGTATVPAEAFLKLVKLLPKGDVAMAAIPDPLRVQVNAGSTKATFVSLSPDDHIRFGEHVPTHRFAMPAATLAGMLRDVAFASPKNEHRGANLFGVCLHHDPAGDRFIAAATNTHKLAQRTVATPPGAAGMPRILVGLRAVEEIARLAEAAGTGQVEVALSDRMIEARGAGTLLRSKLVDQQFPPYERVLPAEPGRKLVVAGEALAQALRRAEAITNPAAGGGVRLDLTESTVTVVVVGPHGAGIVEQLDGEYEGGTDTLHFSAKIAQEILQAVGSDVVHVEVSQGTHKITVWRRPNDRGLTYLLMPRLA